MVVGALLGVDRTPPPEAAIPLMLFSHLQVILRNTFFFPHASISNLLRESAIVFPHPFSFPLPKVGDNSLEGRPVFSSDYDRFNISYLFHGPP